MAGVTPPRFRVGKAPGNRDRPARFFRVVVDAVERDSADAGYFRIKAGGLAFFLVADHFADISGLGEITSGTEVFIGAHAIDNGGYLVHWLHAAGSLDLPPMEIDELLRRKQTNRNLGTALLHGGFALFAVALCVGLASARPEKAAAAPILGILSVAAIAAGVTVRHYADRALRALKGARGPALLDGLEQARRGDAAEFETPDAEGMVLPPPGAQWDDLSVSGAAKGVEASCDAGPSVDPHSAIGARFTVYHFSCRGRRFSFPTPWPHRQALLRLPPLLFRKRPLFVAEDDQVTVVPIAHAGLMRRLSKVTPFLRWDAAVALVNREDGGVETSWDIQIIPPRAVYWLLGAVSGLLVMLSAVMGFFTLLLAGEVVKYGVVLLFVVFCGIFVATCLGLLWELALNGWLALTGDPGRRRRWEARVSELLNLLVPGCVPLLPAPAWRRTIARFGALAGVAGFSLLALSWIIEL